MPTQKITAVGLAGAIVTVIVFGLTQLHIELPVEVVAGLQAVLTFVVGYLRGENDTPGEHAA